MQHWSMYWQTSGVLNSFAEGDANQGYTGAIKKFWDQSFDSIPQGAIIVDAGCGNGALALLAYDFGRANQKDFVIEGLDAAEINPVKQFEKQPAVAKKLKTIKFHSATPISAAPYTAESVDAVISQFAFEYAEQGSALAKVSEILKPGGKLITMSHHASSKLVKDSKVGVEVLTAILEESPLFQQADLVIDLAMQAIPQLGDEGWAEYPHNRILSQSTKWMMDSLLQRFDKPEQQTYVKDAIARVARVLQAMNGSNLEQARKQLTYDYHVLADHKKRLDEQLQSAYAKKDITALKKAATKAGLKLEAEPFEVEGEVFSWTITAEKA